MSQLYGGQPEEEEEEITRKFSPDRQKFEDYLSRKKKLVHFQFSNNELVIEYFYKVFMTSTGLFFCYASTCLNIRFLMSFFIDLAVVF